MSGKRKQHSAEFKARVPLAAAYAVPRWVGVAARAARRPAKRPHYPPAHPLGARPPAGAQAPARPLAQGAPLTSGKGRGVVRLAASPSFRDPIRFFRGEP